MTGHDRDPWEGVKSPFDAEVIGPGDPGWDVLAMAMETGKPVIGQYDPDTGEVVSAHVVDGDTALPDPLVLSAPHVIVERHWGWVWRGRVHVGHSELDRAVFRLGRKWTERAARVVLRRYLRVAGRLAAGPDTTNEGGPR